MIPRHHCTRKERHSDSESARTEVVPISAHALHLESHHQHARFKTCFPAGSIPVLFAAVFDSPKCALIAITMDTALLDSGHFYPFNCCNLP